MARASYRRSGYVTIVAIKRLRVDLAGAIISIAASAHALWVITSEGEIWFTEMAKIGWTKVDRPKNASNEKVAQVRSSPSGKYVWISAPFSGRSWSRTEITESDRKGKTWSEVVP